MEKALITFRMPDGVVQVTVSGSVHRVRQTIRSMLNRKWHTGTFEDVDTGEKVKIELAEIETYTVKVVRF